MIILGHADTISIETLKKIKDELNFPLISNYSHPYISYMDFSDKFKDEEIPTTSKLIELAKKHNIELEKLEKTTINLDSFILLDDLIANCSVGFSFVVTSTIAFVAIKNKITEQTKNC